jgi:hypothetical protein
LFHFNPSGCGDPQEKKKKKGLAPPWNLAYLFIYPLLVPDGISGSLPRWTIGLDNISPKFLSGVS